jgi:glycerophosphoryl diester phosphodiesterase
MEYSETVNMEKCLYAIIRKPQEGKTFICLENIQSSPESYHLIITMNTIKSNLQFFERAKARFGRNICVFNSRGNKKDENPDYLHAKDVNGVKKHLKNGSNVVIMCAHHKRFDQCILDLLEEIDDSQRIRK